MIQIYLENKANVFSTDLIHVYKNNDQHKGKSFSLIVLHSNTNRKRTKQCKYKRNQ